jgi:hypothetical protein
MTSSTMLDAALDYAAHGVPVFPVWGVADGRCSCGHFPCGEENRNAGKHPLASLAPHGFKDATTDHAIITDWWTQHPNANIGSPTTWSSVLDVDPRHGGDVALAELEQQHAPLPDTPEVLTGGGGRHVKFKSVPGLASSSGRVGPGLDIKATGGYVLLPPSSHVSGGMYLDEVMHPLFETELAPMPAWLVASATAPATSSTNGNAPSAGENWAALLNGAGQGQRHAMATRIAGHFLGKKLPSAEVEEILVGFGLRCVPPFPADECRKIVRGLASKDAARGAQTRNENLSVSAWPEPEPVPTDLLPVPAFDIRLLPRGLDEWVQDVTERAQCPPDFVAVGAVVSIAAVVGRQVTIRPKRHDDWTVVPNLWALVVGRPGLMKSAAMQEAQRGLRRLIADAREAHTSALEEHEFCAARAKARRAAAERQLKDAVTNGGPTEALREAFDASRVPDPPVERRYLVNDATVEKLGELLNLNQNGLMVFRDEISGLLRSMDREGHENDRAFYCEAWNGTGGYSYDRISRGTLHIEAACVSVLGGIQPMPLGAYLRETFGNGQDDGLIQRFQLLVYPDISKDWRNEDRWPNSDARQRVVDLFRGLDRLDLEALAVHREHDGLPFLHFAPEAQERFDAWHAELERRLRMDPEHPVLWSHFGKYRSLMPSLALLFHVVDSVMGGTGGPVSADATDRAIAWCDYLAPHARRVYEQVTASDRAATAALAKKITVEDLTSPFTFRDVYRKKWTGLSIKEDVQTAIYRLEELHWLHPERVGNPEGGPRTTQYHINPLVPRRPR